jgi:hypothetical protein
MGEVSLDAVGPVLPGQLLVLLGLAGGPLLRVVAVQLQVAQLGVGDEDAVDEEGTADACAEGEQDDRARRSRPAPKLISATPAASASLTTVTGRPPRRSLNNTRASVSIQLLSTLAAVRIVDPPVTTPGKVRPTGPLQP